MKVLSFLEAMDQLDDRIILEVASTMNSTHNNKRRSFGRKLTATLLVAAALLALSAAAYATGFFGLRALEKGESYSADTVNGEKEFVGISITQPQDVPDEADEAIREKVENSEKAWAEWLAWCEANTPAEPAVFTPPDASCYMDMQENGDGSCTVSFYRNVDDEGNYLTAEELWANPPIEQRQASAEELAALNAAAEYQRSQYPGYDFNYHVHDAAGAAALEEIAARYGLELRREMERFLDADMQAVPDDLEGAMPRAELTAWINENFGSGCLFAADPYGYDKFYYYDDGTFAVSWYPEPLEMRPLGDSWIEVCPTWCYLYNSPYGTLSSGDEIGVAVTRDALESAQCREYSAADGTLLNVVQLGGDGIGGMSQTFAYVYLDDSFVVLQITSERQLTDAEVDAILDTVNFGSIG